MKFLLFESLHEWIGREKLSDPGKFDLCTNRYCPVQSGIQMQSYFLRPRVANA